MDYLTRGQPSMVLCLRAQNAIKQLLDIVNGSDWLEASLSSSKAIFGLDVVANGLYGQFLISLLLSF